MVGGRMTPARFTVAGGPGVEALLRELTHQAARAFATVLDPSQRRALVLFGGYGRGEGGVVESGGAEVPHNNLDLLLVTDTELGAETRRRIDQALAGLERRYGVELDWSSLSAQRLARQPGRVLWYDLRHGHRTLLGDARLVPNLLHHEVDDVPPAEFRNLLTNRGTLLLINRAIRDRGHVGPRAVEVMARHVAKAVIGHGDAALYQRGQYHWSYSEKLRRVEAVDGISSPLRRAYRWAADYRFRPRPESLDAAELARREADVLPTLAEVHLELERFRLALPDLTWSGYLRAAARAEFRASGTSLRELGRRARELLRSPDPGDGLGMVPRLALMSMAPISRLSLLYPFVAYDVGTKLERDVVARVLRARGCASEELRRAYLTAWGAAADAAFGRLVEEFGLGAGEVRP
jgi:hypothetical protein